MGAAGSGAGGGLALSACTTPELPGREQPSKEDGSQAHLPDRRWSAPGSFDGSGVGKVGSSPGKPPLRLPIGKDVQADRRPRQLPSLSLPSTVSSTLSGGSTNTPSTVSSSAGSGSSIGSVGTPAAAQGLASRRKFQVRPSNGGEKGLSISTKREPAEGKVRVAGIRQANFQAEYDIGKEVMPSCHRGMQVMYAKNRSSNHDVVVKIRFKKESFRNHAEELEWRMNTEYMLNLPDCLNIAQLYEVVEDDKAYYVIMEKVDGKDLFESISGQELLPLPEVREIVAQILSGLAELHNRGRIHKDLKLENVMLEHTPSSSTKRPSFGGFAAEAVVTPKSPSVKLIDFDTLEEFVPETPKRTKDVLGTDQYIAQEAYDGNYSPASDIFAAGVIAFRLCTGKFPFKSDMFDDKPGENWVGSPKMKEIRGKLRTFKIKWSYRAFETEPAACDLIRSMLAVGEMDRPSASQALMHPWLQHTLAASSFFANGCSNSPSRGGGPAWASEGGAAAAAPALAVVRTNSARYTEAANGRRMLACGMGLPGCAS